MAETTERKVARMEDSEGGYDPPTTYDLALRRYLQDFVPAHRGVVKMGRSRSRRKRSRRRD